ncbi:MAG: ABC transporter permease [Caldilineaceae bacterium]|nr:ABC transporter permease [Caldilineaceae bacterium]
MAVAPMQQTRTTVLPKSSINRRSEWGQAWRRFRSNRAALIGLVFILLICLMAVFAEWLIPYDPTYSFPGMRGKPPSVDHWLGFDHIGRDLFSRIIYGARIALIVGLVATAVSLTIGVLVGALAGYFGGWVDAVLSRIVDTLMAFPLLALLIVLSAVLGPSLTTTIVVIGATTWARFARVVRADVMSLKQTDFITAARATGVRNAGIIGRHIIPNVLGPVIVLASLGVGGVIILESSLSFLGLGIQAPTPSWGGTLSDGRALIRQFPHIATFPGIMIFITVLAFNLLGDGVRDALDPKQRAD